MAIEIKNINKSFHGRGLDHDIKVLDDVNLNIGDGEVGWSRPAIKRSRVVLPQPEGPMIATNSPFFTSSETLFNAVVSTSSVRNTLLKFSIFIIRLKIEFCISLYYYCAK